MIFSFEKAVQIETFDSLLNWVDSLVKETKAIVAFEESFAKLDIRIGRVIEVDLESRTHKPTYKMVVDFGKFGKKVSYGRFTNHPIGEHNIYRILIGIKCQTAIANYGHSPNASNARISISTNPNRRQHVDSGQQDPDAQI